MRVVSIDPATGKNSKVGLAILDSSGRPVPTRALLLRSLAEQEGYSQKCADRLQQDGITEIPAAMLQRPLIMRSILESAWHIGRSTQFPVKDRIFVVESAAIPSANTKGYRAKAAMAMRLQLYVGVWVGTAMTLTERVYTPNAQGVRKGPIGIVSTYCRERGEKIPNTRGPLNKVVHAFGEERLGRPIKGLDAANAYAQGVWVLRQIHDETIRGLAGADIDAAAASVSSADH